MRSIFYKKSQQLFGGNVLAQELVLANLPPEGGTKNNGEFEQSNAWRDYLPSSTTRHDHWLRPASFAS